MSRNARETDGIPGFRPPVCALFWALLGAGFLVLSGPVAAPSLGSSGTPAWGPPLAHAQAGLSAPAADTSDGGAASERKGAGRASASVTWIVADPERGRRRLETSAPLDSLRSAARDVLLDYQIRGHYEATIAEVDTIERPAGGSQIRSETGELPRDGADAFGSELRIVFHVDPGPRSVLGSIAWAGIDSTRARELDRLLDLESGRAVRPEALHRGIDRVRRTLRTEGHPLAEVRIAGASLEAGSRRLRLRIHVDLGPSPILDGVRIPDSLRVRPDHVARLAGYRLGAPIERFEPREIRRRLLQSGLFRQVGRPELIVGHGRRAELAVPLVEGPPGQFDLALGYQPSDGGGGSGLVGSGHLALHNLLGEGRRFRLQLHRMPGQVSRVQVRAGWPYPFEMPLRLRARFEGYQQDSTYGRRGLEVGGTTRLEPGLTAGLTLRRSLVREGAAGARSGVRSSNGWFAGLLLRWDRRARALAPTDGWRVEAAVETGRTRPRGGGASERQERYRLEARIFWSPWTEQVIVAGLDARHLESPDYDLSDLYRIGGAETLRGYNDEQFAVRTAVRPLLEYRLMTGLASYAYLFAEAGYLDRPAYGSVPAHGRLRPAFGGGLQMETGLGLVNVAFGANPRDGLPEGRVHVSLSMGL